MSGILVRVACSTCQGLPCVLSVALARAHLRFQHYFHLHLPYMSVIHGNESKDACILNSKTQGLLIDSKLFHAQQGQVI